jgi:hypothetical protein
LSVVIDGKPELVPGIASASFLDAPSMRVLREDRRPRITSWIRSIILHTTVGDEPQVVRPGKGTGGMAARTVGAWQTDYRHAGSHLIIDGDGSVFCLADLLREATYHATTINEVSVGIEICQSPGLEIWQAQIDAAIALCDWLTGRFGIQQQIHAPYRPNYPVRRLANGGLDCVGIFGHRDQTDQRGRGDPGDAVLAALQLAGYESFDYASDHDKEAWRLRQSALGVGADGIPGPDTVRALLAAGYPQGLWAMRASPAPDAA